jgi:outer membrane immunogenic protein
MQRVVLPVTALAAMLLAAPAGAQGVSWTGVYVGAHAGYGWGEHEGVGVYTDPNWKPCEDGCVVTDPAKFDLEGGFGGGQIGFNVQNGAFLFGVEGDGSFGAIEGNGAAISDPNANGVADYTWNINTEAEWLASIRGRVGILVTPTLLLYGTGGVAWAGLSSSEEVICHAEQCLAGNDPTTVRAKSSETSAGWVAGVGGEWRFASNWSLKAEWQHYEFDNVDTAFSGTAYPDNDPLPAMAGYTNDSFPGSIVIDTAKVGLNYKF